MTIPFRAQLQSHLRSVTSLMFIHPSGHMTSLTIVGRCGEIQGTTDHRKAFKKRSGFGFSPGNPPKIPWKQCECDICAWPDDWYCGSCFWSGDDVRLQIGSYIFPNSRNLRFHSSVISYDIDIWHDSARLSTLEVLNLPRWRFGESPAIPPTVIFRVTLEPLDVPILGGLAHENGPARSHWSECWLGQQSGSGV